MYCWCKAGSKITLLQHCTYCSYKLWNMIQSYSTVFIVGVRCCDMIRYVVITYCGCKETVYDKAVAPSCWLFDAIKAEKLCVCVCVCVCVRERERETVGEAAPVAPTASHTCGANGASAPAPRGPMPSCYCQPDSNTGGVKRQVTTLPSSRSSASYPFLSHTLHRPFIPHALTLNYFHT